MNVSYLIQFHVISSQRERFLLLLSGVLDAMRHEATFVSAMFNADPEDELHFLLFETWANHDDVVDVQLKRTYRDEWHAALPELLARTRDVTVWEPLRADIKSSQHQEA